MSVSSDWPESFAGFFDRLSAASGRLLMLDYDGTLAPFVVDRFQARPYPGVRELLAELCRLGRTRLVVVSGRSVADLLPLLGLDPAPEIWGCHGWERRLVDGTTVPALLPPAAGSALEAAFQTATRNGWRQRLEQKPATLALHWRDLTPTEQRQLRPAVRDLWTPLAEEGGLELHEFDGGLELRCPGRDKGTAVKSLLKGFSGAAAYLGDDLTDEDAFAALKGAGLGVLVRETRRPTAAEAWLRPPQELLDFLRRWRDSDLGEGG